ncbi:hypothetical protein D0Y65_050644, partial [Glycine soja]
ARSRGCPPITNLPEGLRWKMVLSSRYSAGILHVFGSSPQPQNSADHLGGEERPPNMFQVQR